MGDSIATEPKPLTPRQAEVLDAYCRLWFEHGQRPTIREWAAAMGIASPNGIMENLRFMERKGCVKILHGNGKARSYFWLLHAPDGWTLLPGGGIVPTSEVAGLIERLQREVLS